MERSKQSLLGLPDSENEATKLFRDVGNYMPIDTA